MEKNFFEWVIFFIQGNWQQFLLGTVTTLFVSLSGTIIGFFLGLGVSLIQYTKADDRSSKLFKVVISILKVLINIYITIFRGTPMIVQAMVIFYGLPVLIGLNLDPLPAALLIVSINTGAYMAEMIRGGVDSVDPGQLEGAQAIGMSHFQAMVNIIFPQAVRNVLPSIGNEFIINIKDTSVLNVIGVTELFFTSKSIAGSYAKYYEVFIITSAIYLFLTFTISIILKSIEKKIDGPKNFEILPLQDGNNVVIKKEKGV
ncbi:MAG: amino acid ABC transporter permease [Aliarcobacter sp.]|nr:amino acid ABC transporter permease [Aliarcobacter sp.]